MYDTQDGYSQYKEMDLAARTAAASPLELVLVLFSGLMDELERAKSHIENKRYERKAQSINKCIDILNALTSSMEFENGGELVVKSPGGGSDMAGGNVLIGNFALFGATNVVDLQPSLVVE